MKILFLDMDGVLNSMPDEETRESWKRKDEEFYLLKLYGIDPDLIPFLKTIINETNCKIVFSSSWRYFKDHHIMGKDWRKSLANSLGVSKDIFIGNTPDISECGGWSSGNSIRRRGYEIKMWLENHTDIAQPGKYKYCIIDDEISDIVPVFDLKYIVQTDYRTGLRMKDVKRTIEILNGD